MAWLKKDLNSSITLFIRSKLLPKIYLPIWVTFLEENLQLRCTAIIVYEFLVYNVLVDFYRSCVVPALKRREYTF